MGFYVMIFTGLIGLGLTIWGLANMSKEEKKGLSIGSMIIGIALIGYAVWLAL